MRINWFKDENHLVYINGATQLAELERTLHFPRLEEAANELRQHPTAEGFTIVVKQADEENKLPNRC